jgi:hypothetical protein
MLDSISTDDLDITSTRIRYRRNSVEFTVFGPDLELFKKRWLAHWDATYTPVINHNIFWRSESCD